MMKLCERCIMEMQSRGQLIAYDHVNYIPCKEAENMNTPCEWCYEFDDLFNAEIDWEA